MSFFCLQSIRLRLKDSTSFKILVVMWGQCLSILMSIAGGMQSELSLQCHLAAPSFSVALYYMGLSLFLIPLYREQQQQSRQPTPTPLQQQQPSSGESSRRPQRRQHVRVDTEERELYRDNDSDDPNDNSQLPVLADNDHNTNLNMPTTPNNNGHTFFGGRLRLEAPAWFYCIMGSLDIYGSFATVSAFHLTTVTSVSLLVSLAIPTTMILSWIFLHRRYSSIHFLGVFLCLLGIVVNVWHDWKESSDATGVLVHTTNGTIDTDDEDAPTSTSVLYPHRFWGDLLACLGGFLYGTNNVLGEIAVRKLGGPNEFLGMMGFFAAIIALLQAAVLERQQIAAFWAADACARSTSLGLLSAFVLANVLGYFGGSRFLLVADATFLNLSFQTGGLWTVLFSIYAEHIVPSPLFYLSLVTTITGVVLYEMAPSREEDTIPDVDLATAAVDDDALSSHQRQQLTSNLTLC